MTVGSYGLFKNSLGFSHTQDNFYLTLQYGHLEIDGFRENNRFERDGVLLNSIFKLSIKSEIGLLVNHIDYSAQIASSINQDAFDEDPRQAAFTWQAAQGFEDNNYSLIGVSHTYKANSKLKNTTSLFYTYLDHYEPRPFNILDEYTNGFGIRTLFSGIISGLDNDLSYTLGSELYKDEYSWGTFENLYRDNNGNGSLQGDRLSKNKEFRRQLNSFATLAYAFSEKLTAQVGLNMNKTNFDFKDLFNTGNENTSASRNFNTIILPSLDLVYTLGTVSYTHLRAHHTVLDLVCRLLLEKKKIMTAICRRAVLRGGALDCSIGGCLCFDVGASGLLIALSHERSSVSCLRSILL